jgi:hypothetical protein
MTVSESGVSSRQYAPEWMLVCVKCGRYTYRTMEDLLFHTRVSWPECCGDIMALITKSDPPIEPKS